MPISGDQPVDFDRIRMESGTETEAAIRLFWLLLNTLPTNLNRESGGSGGPLITASEISAANVDNIIRFNSGIRWLTGPWLISETAVVQGAQLTGNVNDYNPGFFARCVILLVSSDAAGRQITGLKSSWANDWQLVYVMNVGSFSITLPNESTASAAVNRFAFPVGLSQFVLPPNVAIGFLHRGTETAVKEWFPLALPMTITTIEPFPPPVDWFASRLHNRSGGVLGLGEPAPTLAGTGTDDTQTTGLFRNLATGAVDGTDASVISGGSSQVSPQHDPTWELIMRTGSSLSAIRIWVLLSNVNATNADDLGGAGQYLGFRYSTVAGDTQWVGVTRDGTTQSVTGNVAAIAVSSTYRLKVRKSGSTVYFSINGGAEVSKTTNLPAATAELFWFIRIFTTEAVSKNFSWGRHWVKYGIAP